MSEHWPTTIEFAVMSTDIAGARELAREHGGTLYVEDRPKRPFTALVTLVSDSLEAARAVGGVGVSIVARRQVKPGAGAACGVYPMIGHPDIGAAGATDHWRDTHAPLALHHHEAMTSYAQLVVLDVIQGLELDGIALCAFASQEDLREKFFTHADSRQVIAKDVAKFADAKRSPAPLRADVERFDA